MEPGDRGCKKIERATASRCQQLKQRPTIRYCVPLLLVRETPKKADP